MRFKSLGLLAFGPLTEYTLDLSGGAPGGLHLIFGANEAGKSTALRAVHGLLYGIPERTGDAHLHPSPDLRIGAVLEAEDGTSLEVVRRKKRKDSLRDPADVPIDEARLARLLGGTDSEMFTRMFGLDHVRLAEAGEALLRGGGDIGETLFDTGLGGLDVRTVLEALDREANALFKPRAPTAQINVLLEQYKTARTAARNAETAPEAYTLQRETLDARIAERDALGRERRRLREEQHRLTSARRVLPMTARRGELRRALGELGGGPALPADCAARRAELLAAIAGAERELAPLERDLEAARERRAGLRVADGLVALSADIVGALTEGIGRTREFLAKKPEIEANVSAAGRDAREALRRLGYDRALDEAEELRLKATKLDKIRRIGARHPLLVERRDSARERLGEVAAERDAARVRLEAQNDPGDGAALESFVARARAEPHLDRRIADADAALRATAESAARKLAALGLFRGTLGELSALALPDIELAQRFEREMTEHLRRRAAAEDALQKAKERSAECASRLLSLQRSGHVPTENELSLARTRRDELFYRMVDAWSAGERLEAEEGGYRGSSRRGGRIRDPQSSAAAAKDGDAQKPLAFALETAVAKPKSPRNARPLVSSFESASVEADAVSDRLRREANRVSEIAALGVELEQSRAVEARLAAELETLVSNGRALDEQWRSAWKPVGVEPRSPREMEAWLRRAGDLVELAHRVLAAEHTLDMLREARRALARAADAVLASTELGSPSGTEEIAARIAACEAELGRRKTAAERRAALFAQVLELDIEHQKAERLLASRENEIAAWRTEWLEVTAPLARNGELSPDDAIGVVDQLAEVFRALDEGARQRRTLEANDRDACAFASLVRRIVNDHAIDLAEMRPDAAAQVLLERIQDARRSRAEADRLDRDIEGLSRERAAAHARKSAAEAELVALLESAGAESPEALERLEHVARERERLEHELSRLEEDLRNSGAGMSVEELIEKVRGLAAVDIDVRLEELAYELERLDSEVDRTTKEITSLETGLKLFETARAADGAQELEALGARIRRDAREYARLRLAAVVLRREIERYRAENQGPLLRRASELFARLTLGRYIGLRVGLEESVLVAIRAEGGERHVHELSEGTRYQLYLALRLASLERYLERQPALPLVLDDVLIHFDDERAEAALSVLADLAARVQVLFFTHHARDLDCARQIVAPGRVFFHELASPAERRPLDDGRAALSAK